MRKLSSTVAIKDYVANTLGNSFAFDNFFAWEHFNIIFICLTSILNTKAQCVLVVITATGFLMAKG